MEMVDKYHCPNVLSRYKRIHFLQINYTFKAIEINCKKDELNKSSDLQNSYCEMNIKSTKSGESLLP